MGHSPLDRVDALANVYASALESHLAGGVTTLFGWSMGGLTAWETARILTRRGVRVNGVVLVDMPAENDTLDRIADLNDSDSLAALFTGVLDLDPDELRRLKPEARTDLVISRGRVAGLFPDDMSQAALKRLFAVYAANGRAAKHYAIPSQNLPVLLIRPRTEHAAPLPYMPSSGPDDYGWSRYALGGVSLRWVGGGHNSLLESPYVEEVAAHVGEFLDSRGQ